MTANRPPTVEEAERKYAEANRRLLRAVLARRVWAAVLRRLEPERAYLHPYWDARAEAAVGEILRARTPATPGTTAWLTRLAEALEDAPEERQPWASRLAEALEDAPEERQPWAS